MAATIARDDWVRAALVNNADHAQRHGHARNIQPVRTLPPRKLASDGIAQFSHRLNTGCNAFQPRRIQRQPVEHGGVQPLLSRSGHIGFVRAEDLVRRRPDRAGHRLQAPRPVCRAHPAQLARSLTGIAPHPKHGFAEICGLVCHRIHHGDGCAGNPACLQDAPMMHSAMAAMTTRRGDGLTLRKFALV